ncbi:MAG: class I SAM-dependent methyltransferase [Nanoarchaeota archaeon]
MKYTNYQEYLREQLSPKDWEIVRSMNLNLNTRAWADLAVDFVNFDKRRAKETSFLISQLREYQYPRVFDACLGTGATSLGLTLADPKMEIIANEIDKNLEKVAREEMKEMGIGLNDLLAGGFIGLEHYDWRDGFVYNKFITPGMSSISDKYDRYDAVLCLGNALTYLFKKVEQLEVVKNFREALRPGGKLIIDERNYAEHFLAQNAKFKCSGEVVYCGTDKVRPQPIYISPTMIVMEYHHLQNGQKVHLVLYPFKKGELCSLLAEADFREIKILGDYQEHFDPKEPEFITYIARK